MMEKNLYHCFVAGLPELHFDGSRVWISPSEFKKKLKLELLPGSRQVLKNETGKPKLAKKNFTGLAFI